jgi:hypothetical protein
LDFIKLLNKRVYVGQVVHKSTAYPGEHKAIISPELWDTRDMQARVNPCALIEFTATPRFNSNILHSVSAPELKTAEMIKLPIILAEHDSWQNAVNGAIASRAALENPRRREACSG